MASVLTAAVTLAVFLVWLPALAEQSPSQGKVLHLDARALELLVQSDPNLSLIDVRTPEELTGPLGKISQASNVPLQEVEKNPEQFPRDKTLVLICRSGHRSLKAANLLAGHGYVVYSVDGGMLTWRKLHPLEAPTAEDGPKKGSPGAPGHTPDPAKPSPPGNRDQPSPENFFNSNMGC